MSREILEKALEKTNEIEEKEVKKLRLAENLGRITGVGLALAMDATAIWLIIKFMLGFAAFTWVNALGVMFLANILYIKFKK
jgi:hypothetical protein